ncbi:hypothetical protein [Bacillus sp. FJAT-45350]|uniref:hypothetical protein n=1 Tax=Bacillus sp. FJAT-45350 TaxID=2011014 RepID=UPI000BB7C66B|nr:hypothetical protein [Bacillus sp. FJAT-45350]
MNSNNEQRQEQSHNFFNDLMFGPPRQQPTEQEIPKEPNNEQEIDEYKEEVNKEEVNTQSNVSTTNNSVPNVNLESIIPQIEQIMSFAQKVGPSINKLAPLLTMLQSFNTNTNESKENNKPKE